ncbi:putative Flagellar hook-associated protein FlgK [uncultured Desulfobacterium sp.]|uniref:Flagellar hook-associated protein 1 n=1 Tax=uncultured Desulfobacterium sp. TaxID=201089 RepID=A0A445MT56_9BACT|nr:putative Flagellar hook-associated protein FlgK [uncultured Desulfobacterium sp.]
MGINATLNIGRDSLLTHQKAMEVSGHNIANVNTPGYSRQRLEIIEKDPIDCAGGQIGTGVTGAEIIRIYDRFLTDQINNSAQDLGRWEAQRDSLERIEIAFDEVSGFGINNAMSEFWNAWQGVANEPMSKGARQLLLEKAEIMVNTFNSVYSDLGEIQNDIDLNISQAIDDINIYASQIEELNDKITLIESSGLNANDYRDERDQVMKELSGLIDFTFSEEKSGAITITLGDGNDLVDSNGANELVANDTDGDGFYDVAWSSAPAVSINTGITGGKLMGWLEVRDTIIPDYLTYLENIVGDDNTPGSLIYEVNDLHDEGYGLDNSTGNDFFSGSLGGGDFAVNITNTDQVAAGQSTASGDNSNAIAIAKLQTSTFSIAGSLTTYDDYYNSIVADIGIKVSNANTRYEHEKSMSEQLDNYRESISGVSLDEEMVNLLKYQHAYNAAAKLITVVDELMEALINMV